FRERLGRTSRCEFSRTERGDRAMKASCKSAERPSLVRRLLTGFRKRGRFWGSLAVGAVALFALARLVSSTSPDPVDADKAALDRLAHFGVRYELDESRRVVSLRLEGSHVTDASLAEVPKLPRLKSLSL